MYRDEDIDKIQENINKIIDNSHNEYKKISEPTLSEVTKGYNAIKDYIIFLKSLKIQILNLKFLKYLLKNINCLKY